MLIKTSELKVQTIYKGDLTLDENAIIIPGNVPISPSILKLLAEWKITEVYCDDDTVVDSTAKKAAQTAKKQEVLKKAAPLKTEAVDISDFM